MATASSERPQYAGFALRFLAILIDSLIFVPNYFIQKITFDQTGAIVASVLLNLLGPLYNILLLGFCGQTLGMMVVKIKVVRLDLSSLRWSNAVLRYIVELFMGILFIYVEVCLMAQAGPEFFHKSLASITAGLTSLDDSFQTFLLYAGAVSLVWTLSELVVLLLNERKRAVHDYIAGTVVVRVGRNKEILTQSQKQEASVLSMVVAVLLVLFFVLTAAGFGYYEFVLKSRLAGFLKPRDDLQAGIRKGQGFVSSSVFLQDDRLGKVTDIAVDRSNPALFWIAGRKSALSVQANGQVSKVISLPAGANNYRWTDAEGKTLLMNVGAWGSDPFLLDADGNLLWNYKGEGQGVDGMAAGYGLQGDSKTQFVVGFNGAGGVHLLDDGGHLVWKVPEANVWHVEVEDLNQDGKTKIVHSDAAGKLVVRNPDGTLLKEYQPPVYTADFTLVDWIGQAGGPIVAMIGDKTKYLFYSFSQAAPVTEWDSGIDLSNGKSRALWVVWNPDTPKSLAVLTSFELSKSSVLTVFDGTGQIQYQEIFSDSCEGLAVIDGAAPGSHTFLCGCGNKILDYQIKS